MKSIVLVGMKKNEIILKLNDESSQEEIMSVIEKKIPVLKKLYREAKNPIKITGKILKDKEMEEIREIIKNEIDVNIIFENVNGLGLSEIKKTYERDTEKSETLFVKGSIRSGQKLEYEGSIVVLGDVNSGAEVIAEDNIVVLGTLRGLAHAGAKGNVKANIASHKIESPQLRIADILKEIEKEEVQELKQFATVVDDKIVLE